MNYRSLLVLLDHTPACAERTRLVIHLAAQRDCHLVGLAPTGLIDIPADTEAAAPLSAYAGLAWRALRDQADDAIDKFRRACQASGLTSFECVVDEDDAIPSLNRHANCSDLVIVSQVPAEAPNHRSLQSRLEHMVLDSARPTLIVPHAGQFLSVGNRVLVAWNDSRESARALGDALPLLRAAGGVKLVQWTESRSEARPEASELLRKRLEAVQRWLLRHGVTAEIELATPVADVGGALWSQADEFGADMVVMGAYGHARWSERMLGGVTQGVFASMRMPVLMSH